MRKMYIDSKFILPALLFIGMVIALAQLGTPSVEAQQDYESVAVISLDPAAVPIGGGIARGGTTEGEPFAIGVVRSDAGFGDTVGDIDVYITVTPGEATPGQDYTDNTGDGIVSTSGENGKILAFPINVTIHDDTICEMTSNVVRETFYVTIDEDATRANNPDAGNFRFENTKVRVRIYDNGNERPNEVFSVWASLKDGTLTAGWGGDGLCGDDLEAQYRLGTSGDWSEFPEPPIIDEDGSRIITGLTGYIAQVRVRSTHTLNGNSDWKTATNDEAFWLTGLRVYSGTRALTLFSTTDSHGNWFYPNWFRYVVKVAPGTRSLDITPAWNGGTDGSVEWDTRDTNSGSSQLASGSIAASGTKTSISLVGGDRPTLIRVHFTIADNTNTYEIYVLYDVGESANNYLNSLQGSMGSGGSSSGQSISMSGSAASSAASGGAVGQISRAGLQLDTLSNTLTLTPAFDEKIFKYTTTVPHDVTQITLDPKPSHPIATVTVNGNSPLTPVNLSAGRNVVKIVVTAENGDKRTYTLVVERPNRAPFVTSPLPDISMRVDRPIGFGVIVQGTFSDPDGDRLDVTSTSSDENVVTASMRNQALLSLSPVSAGTAVITVTAKDDRGGTAQDSFTVVVSSDDQNQQKAAPVVASAIADISGLEAEDSRTISMSAVFSDPDGDTVTVTQASSSDISIAAVSAAIDGSTSAITAITVTGVSEGTATITVTARDADGNTVSDAFDVTVNAPAAQQQVNNAPTVSAAIADATIVNETGTHRVALSGVFSDADGDALKVTTSSSAESVASVAVSADYSTLTVSAKSRGTATVTVNAADGYGGSVEDSFAVTVKAAPVVASASADVTGLEVGSTRDISLPGVFSDADGDSLTVTASSSDEGKATVSVASDQSTLTVSGVAEGTATVTVAARDSDGNKINDAFQVDVVKAPVPEPEPVELPGPVVNLQLTATDNGVIVSWQAPESGDAPRRYIVHVRPEGGENGSGRTKTPKAKKTKVSFDNLEAGRTYKVWVRAENEAGKGERFHASITIPAVQ